MLSGLWLGLFVGLIFSLFNPPTSAFALLLACALWGVLFGLIWSLVGYAFTRGTRDFSSVSQVVATKYEVFTEHKFAQQAREILAKVGIRSSGWPASARRHAVANRGAATAPGGPHGRLSPAGLVPSSGVCRQRSLPHAGTVPALPPFPPRNTGRGPHPRGKNRVGLATARCVALGCNVRVAPRVFVGKDPAPRSAMPTPSRRPTATGGLVVGLLVAAVLAACANPAATRPAGQSCTTVGPMRTVPPSPSRRWCARVPGDDHRPGGMTVPQQPQGVDGNARLLPDRQPESLVVCSYPVLDMVNGSLTAPFRLKTRTVLSAGEQSEMVELLTWAPLDNLRSSVHRHGRGRDRAPHRVALPGRDRLGGRQGRSQRVLAVDER